MTQDEIHYLFTLSGGISYSGGTRYSMTNTQLKDFVNILVNAERESCAEIAFKTALTDATPGRIADAIRGRNG